MAAKQQGCGAMQRDDAQQLVGIGIIDGPDKQHACIVDQYLHTPAIGPALLDNMFCGSGLREVYTQDGGVNAILAGKCAGKLPRAISIDVHQDDAIALLSQLLSVAPPHARSGTRDKSIQWTIHNSQFIQVSGVIMRIKKK